MRQSPWFLQKLRVLCFLYPPVSLKFVSRHQTLVRVSTWKSEIEGAPSDWQEMKGM